MTQDLFDPKGLISEAYKIEGISAPECRSIFLDWALGVPADGDAPELAGALLAHYQVGFPDHPMTEVLAQSQTRMSPARRRGGRGARLKN